MSSSTVERVVIHCASTARLSGDAARVSQAACSAGRRYGRPPGRARRCVQPSSRRATRARSARRGRPRRPAPGSSRASELGERVEEPGTVPDGDHHRERAAVQQVEHAPGERLGTLRVERRSRARHLLRSGLDSSVPLRAHLRTLRTGEPRRARASATRAVRPWPSPAARERSGASSRSSSSISSVSPHAPRSSIPRTSARS